MDQKAPPWDRLLCFERLSQAWKKKSLKNLLMTRWETTQIPIYQVNKKGWKSHLKSSLCLLFFPFYGKEGHNKNMTYSEKGNESSKGHVGISGERVHTHCSKKSTRCRFKEYTRASSCSLIAILPATLSCKCYKLLGVWIHCF